jgi:hypothetical protein
MNPYFNFEIMYFSIIYYDMLCEKLFSAVAYDNYSVKLFRM